uniref:Uncharacterized protein n=1 Tax=Moniliophthora roreri TaxID=221103 RepID=A0A0W0G8G2_MONRR
MVLGTLKTSTVKFSFEGKEVFAMLERLKATMAAVGEPSPFVADQLRRLTRTESQ